MKEMVGPLQDLGYSFEYDEKALRLLARKGGGKYAARDLRSTIRREVEDRIASLILEGIPDKKKIFVSADDQNILVTLS